MPRIEMLAQHFEDIRLVHVACVAVSGTLFAVRGVLAFFDPALGNRRLLRFTSHLIDTTLLTAAVLLTLILHQFPGTDAWLTTKVLLLVLYIGLGTVALRRGRTRAIRALAFMSALFVFAYIIGVAMTHHPAGRFLYLRQ